MRLPSLRVALCLAVGLFACAWTTAQIAPDHYWVGFADKTNCGVELNAADACREIRNRLISIAGEDGITEVAEDAAAESDDDDQMNA